LSNLLRHYVLIALLKGSPKDLPGGIEPMLVAVILNWLTYVLALSSIRSLGVASMIAVIDLALTAVALLIALSVAQKIPRFHQAYGGLCGASAMLNLAALPMLWLSGGDQPASFGLLDLLLLVWGLSLISHVLQQTLEITRLLGVGLAVAYYLLVLNVFASLNLGNNEVPNENYLHSYQTLTKVWSVGA